VDHRDKEIIKTADPCRTPIMLRVMIDLEDPLSLFSISPVGGHIGARALLKITLIPFRYIPCLSQCRGGGILPQTADTLSKIQRDEF
jgi:hypothetical protein